MSSTFDGIAACAAEYASAREQLSESGGSLAEAEAVLRARVAFAECLVRAGWSPPPEIYESLMLDRHALDEPVGSIEAKCVQPNLAARFVGTAST